MRKTVIYCDKCGVEITGIPIQIVPEYIDRETGDIWPDTGEKLPLWIRRMLDKEFCERCAKKVFNFALNNVDADEKEPDRKESGSSSNEKKIKMRVFRNGIRVNGSNIWSKEFFPYIGLMVDVEITHKSIVVKDGEKVLFRGELPD